MICENDFCVYYQEGACILDEISIDTMGLCSACIFVSIEEEVLNRKRQEFLKRSKEQM